MRRYWFRCPYLPQHVKYFPIGIDSNQDVRDGDELELGVLRVGEVYLGLPNSLHKVWVVEVERLRDLRVLEPLVLPLLSQV